ncbi:hypothetical protein Afil01_25150 [Actinorhabdospora filicis]|uniref:Uncharacterized protein n=1 Tax=Actinorhabdospora filicis TaxID=1785913 RepID=A0A9W6W971_9ACTN|nr:hypothetical protein Afil01_25150 [Actinorhabdospora filicis]
MPSFPAAEAAKTRRKSRSRRRGARVGVSVVGMGARLRRDEWGRPWIQGGLNPCERRDRLTRSRLTPSPPHPYSFTPAMLIAERRSAARAVTRLAPSASTSAEPMTRPT